MSSQNYTPDYTEQIKYVSHEIRNHLSICDMYSQIIKKNLQKTDIKNPSIDNALNCIQQSLQIIESNLLDLKSLNKGKNNIIDFETIIRQGTELAKAYIIDKDINISVFVKNTAYIDTDENRLLAVLVNIIKNAIEAIAVKGEIEILAEIKDKQGIIRISNNGKPISKDKAEKIFQQGYTSKQNGNGIGLWLCKKYLNEQNSQITLLRSGKKQTTFEIILPIADYQG